MMKLLLDGISKANVALKFIDQYKRRNNTMYVYKANEAYEATKKRAQQKEAIHNFLLTKECTIILTKIKDSIQCGSYRAFFGRRGVSLE